MFLSASSTEKGGEGEGRRGRREEREKGREGEGRRGRREEREKGEEGKGGEGEGGQVYVNLQSMVEYVCDVYLPLSIS